MAPSSAALRAAQFDPAYYAARAQVATTRAVIKNTSYTAWCTAFTTVIDRSFLISPLSGGTVALDIERDEADMNGGRGLRMEFESGKRRYSTFETLQVESATATGSLGSIKPQLPSAKFI